MRGTMTMKERVTEWLTYVAAGFTRHFVHLPNDPLYSDLREQLRKLEAAPQASKETVLRFLRDLKADMSRADRDLFTRTKIGRASGRERVGQDVETAVVAVYLKKKR